MKAAHQISLTHLEILMFVAPSYVIPVYILALCKLKALPLRVERYGIRLLFGSPHQLRRHLRRFRR